MTSNPIDAVLKQIQEQHQLTIKRLGDSTWPTVERIPTGSLSLDYALGGGWPRGRFAEIYGQPSGGKTFLTLCAIAEAQKLGGKAAFLDVEHAFDPAWASKLGVNVDDLYLTQPDYGEQALEAVYLLATSNQFDAIVLDSVAELLPKEELEANIEDHKIALQARMMSRALKKLSPAIGKSKAVVLFVNQTRTNPMLQYGDPTTTPGGASFKFYSSVRVQVSRVSKSERYDATPAHNIVGHDIHVNVVKNKTASPFRQADIPIEYLGGVMKLDDMVKVSASKGLFIWSGGVRYQGKSVESIKEQRWPSWDAFKAWFADPSTDKAVIEALTKEIRFA